MRIFSPLLLCLAIGSAHATDHNELDATLLAPYRGAAGSEARTFTIVLERPELETPQTVAWRFDLAGADGRVLNTWRGAQLLSGPPVTIEIAWDGRLNQAAASAGTYRAILTADDIEQSWEIAVGPLTAPAPAPLSLAPSPWQIVLGNLHSQTGHSDGGGDLASCHGAQSPQSSLLGPAQAFEYADRHGLDFLVASEHNHMYDGSTGTNANAEPRSARGLYQAGLAAAADYNRAHPGFLGIYATEWGVIDNGGHLNIFNAPGLPGWEKNGAGDLLADIDTPKNDYAALYATMRQRGWIGQFNHPANSGQFIVDGKALGYTPDGDAAMVLCEVVNTNAFSTSELEAEARRSIYEGACNQALEAGYHVAFSTDQDNHCANWGMSYTNRTGVLLRAGQPFTENAFFDALRARRVFATMDKTSTLLFTANGRIMGERFVNRGPLQLLAHYSAGAGKSAATVAVFEGVPGRNGTVTALSDSFDTTITPSVGEHFYYARVTQTDGNILWSAPVWVSQQAERR
ncbi:MAG: carbohydrate-binding protein CenC [Massilia sp.]|nr:carbohydrate-binding protein CenC [Massilia sp.]